MTPQLNHSGSTHKSAHLPLSQLVCRTHQTGMGYKWPLITPPQGEWDSGYIYALRTEVKY